MSTTFDAQQNAFGFIDRIELADRITGAKNRGKRFLALDLNAQQTVVDHGNLDDADGSQCPQVTESEGFRSRGTHYATP